MKKILSLMLVSFMVLVTFIGCGEQSKTSNAGNEASATVNRTSTENSKEVSTKKDTELTYLTMSINYPKEQDRINEALGKAYPGITLDISHVADNYETVLKTKFAAGDSPDLFDWHGYLSNKAFVDAGFFLDITDDNIVEPIMENFRTAGMYNGRVYGVPTIAQGSGLIYNKQVFEKVGINQPPKTISELKSAADTLKRAGFIPFATGFKDVWISHQMFWCVLGPNVGDFNTWYNDMNSGKVSLMSEKVDRSFELIDIVLANTVDNPLSSDNTNLCHLIGSGKAGMAFQGVWEYEEIAKNDPDVQVGLAPIPVSENPEDATLMYEAQGVVFISAKTKHPAEAKDVLRWLVSKDGVEAIGAVTKQASPVNVDAKIELNPLSVDGDNYVKAGGKTVGFIKTYWPAALPPFVGKQIQSYIAKTITKEEFFKSVEDEWKKLISQQQ
jgi:raffinose/stachyose/melibiose transport system substrate-binding protein